MGRIYESITELIGNTPLLRLNGFGREKRQREKKIKGRQ